MKFFEPFEPPVAPTFPNKDFNIVDFGAKQGKENVIKEPLAKAIAECSAQGGGRVVIPKGNWFTGGPIHLKSNVNLHFAEGAFIEFSTEFNDYLPVVYGLLAGNRVYSVSHFIYAYQCKNIAVTGKGVLDGHGDVWWPMKHHQPGMEDLMKKGKNLAPVSERVYDKPEHGVRPHMIQFVECENILIEGITLTNSPSWTVHPVWCKNITVRGITIDNPHHSHNTDGVNLEYCKRGLVEGCVISGGDDMCCLKAGRDADAWEAGWPCEDIEIRNCHALNCRGGGFTIGSEMSACVRNIWVHDCIIEIAKSAFNLKTMKGRGGVIENIFIENIEMRKATRDVIRMTLRYTGEPLDDYSQPDNNMPMVRNISINNLVCHSSPKAITMVGVKDYEIENIDISNATIHVKGDSTIENVRNLSFNNLTIYKEDE